MDVFERLWLSLQAIEQVSAYSLGHNAELMSARNCKGTDHCREIEPCCSVTIQLVFIYEFQTRMLHSAQGVFPEPCMSTKHKSAKEITST